MDNITRSLYNFYKQEPNTLINSVGVPYARHFNISTGWFFSHLLLLHEGQVLIMIIIKMDL